MDFARSALSGWCLREMHRLSGYLLGGEASDYCMTKSITSMDFDDKAWYNKTAFNGKRLQFLSCRWMEKLGGEREMLPGFFILVGQF